ncbi:MAG TPA: hypothetical protein RMH85_28360 [Polyangiaceae bacterium LLY-WYZ-15_(1-7)]|nr:hypothetical protein [Polyangiaceae bacterium LLY-WYZ-15_(1-7)]HJL12427.1 hypothetical protein [Polyangiaceae bacterium LLY-WYZ-15_(1-7)]HJL27046.1 hypothetical protein [Polyangiaceae bacterium LLY-WYZ-15_(1-7)]HJL39017.1 hypothetical protein [Polyangiaceae bacterium LLY-WYZ-15_(1-7)]
MKGELPKARVLRRVQERLAALYDVDPPDLGAFLCEEATVRAIADAELARGELLLVLEEEDGVFVALWVDDAAVEAFERGAPPATPAWEQVTEGVSHFVYLAFREANEEAVSQLELEVQAEVDKYAVAMLEGWGAGLVRAREREGRSRALRQALFEEAEFIDPAGSERGERYRVANRVAGRFAAQLEARFVAENDRAGLVTELRRFYRKGQRGKLAAAGY